MNRLNPWVLIGLALTEIPLALWGGISVFMFAVAVNVPHSMAWIPAVALGGVMLASTMFSIQPAVADTIRLYAGWLATLAIGGEITVAGAAHYFQAKAPDGHGMEIPGVDPVWGFVIGGLPSLMGGALIHITAMYFAQRRREVAELDAEVANLETARGVRATEAAELAEHLRSLAATRQADEAAATRSRQAVQQELQQAEQLKGQLRATLVEVEETNTALDEARREQERLRSRERRQRDKTTPQPAASQPASQPVADQQPTVSQPASRDTSQPASRQERRDWAREQIRSGAWERETGRELTGADIDRRFGPPRTGAAILRELDAERDAELRALTGERADERQQGGGH